MRAFTDSEIEELLRRESDGVLAMASGDEPYAIPLSFGYDGSRIVFQLSGVDGGRKMAFIEDNPEVVLVVHDTRANKVAESVVARGPIERVPAREERAAFETLRRTPNFPSTGRSGAARPARPEANSTC